MEVVNKGDKFELLETINHTGLTHWHAIAYTGSFHCLVPKRTLLVATMDAVGDARGFYCVPVRYFRSRGRFVPWKYRWHPLFAGYSFVFTKDDIGTVLRRV